MYKDEYTAEPLPYHNIREAMLDEMTFLCKEVLEGVSMEEVLEDPDRVVISGRWINSNKVIMQHQIAVDDTWGKR